jgi:hypothetical protein
LAASPAAARDVCEAATSRHLCCPAASTPGCRERVERRGGPAGHKNEWRRRRQWRGSGIAALATRERFAALSIAITRRAPPGIARWSTKKAAAAVAPARPHRWSLAAIESVMDRADPRDIGVGVHPPALHNF